ncbi:MAG: hypothetical protein JSU70_12295 [Phycisphaerales bacterium]|nr:MAG: hypothetical protein JSU70_12295 [Phycisphaerales bacterium]
MCAIRSLKILVLVLFLGPAAFGADVILNEYNAVSKSEFLNGGTAEADDDGGRAADSYFGRIPGNGGNWFELVVITDHLDMRSWRLDIFQGGVFDETLDLTDHAIWSDLRSGTIITVSEDLPSDASYDPAAGDWWINVQANDNGDGLFIEKSNFPVSANDWQLMIKDASNAVVFGPAGEGISPASGVGGTEIFQLEGNPDSSVTADSTDYDDGSDFSTFGAPNRWGAQHFDKLRNVAPTPASITVLSPNGSELLAGGAVWTVEWQSQGTIGNVMIEFSTNGGSTWQQVFPPNIGNAGRYDWLAPIIRSDHCLVRASSTTRPGIADVSNQPFSLYLCELVGDINDDCIVDMFDLALMASEWLASTGM